MFKVGDICVIVGLDHLSGAYAKFNNEECVIEQDEAFQEATDLEDGSKFRGKGYVVKLLRDGLQLLVHRKNLRPKRDDNDWAKERVASLIKSLTIKLPDGFKVKEKEKEHV